MRVHILPIFMRLYKKMNRERILKEIIDAKVSLETDQRYHNELTQSESMDVDMALDALEDFKIE